jgi:beta-phosphoglucomutase-like phosphatase (HAD superfamily)
MRFIVEFDGPICDVSKVHHLAHQAAAKEVGWSRLDQATFWRLTRTKGREADLLPGARDGKLNEYHAKFAEHVEADELVAAAVPLEDIARQLRALAGKGPCVLVTLGRNLPARVDLLKKAGLAPFFVDFQSLSADPRRRPSELRVLAANERRTIVVASTDALIRSAGQSDLFTVGIPLGVCAAKRLHQAGASVVHDDLDELLATFRDGAADIIRAGLSPAPLDAGLDA